MKVTFFSNFLNHHQLPFSMEMTKHLGENFCFVETEPIEQERLDMGYEDMGEKYTFVLKSYKNDECYRLALKKGYESDVVIIGSAPEIFIQERLKDNKVTFRYTERILKEGLVRILDPRVSYGVWKQNTRYKKKNMFLLCASAYTSYDMHLFGAYPGKMYKWGYFPEVKHYNIDDLLKKKKENKQIFILWAGRFLKWKHPELAVGVAEKLKKNGYVFKLMLIGDGEMKEELVKEVQQKELQDVVLFKGFMSPDAVRKYMEKADIFLFTSDFNEGWGAVLNESMNSGCAVVVSHAIGSVPFLVKHGVNGMIFKSGDENNLSNLVMQLCDDEELRINLGRQAYKTLSEEWNAKNATINFLKLSNAIMKNKTVEISSGPCSTAEIISQRKMYDFLRKEH